MKIFVLDVMPLFVYFVVFLFFIKKYPYFFVLFFYIFMQHIKNLLSNFYLNVNAPVFMREVEKYSINDSSLFMLTLFYISFYLLFIFIYKYFKARFKNYKNLFLLKRNSKEFVYFFFFITFIIILLLIIHILLHNTPLFHDNINKNNYWTNYALIPQLKFLSSQLSALLFILGFVYARQKLFGIYYLPTLWFYVLLILSIFYYILMKQKFGGPLLMLYSFFSPYFLLGFIYKKINLNKIFGFIILFIVFLSVTVYGYFYMRFGNDAVKMIIERVFALQSEMWEVTYNYFLNNRLPFDNNEFLRELQLMFGFLDNGYVGMQYVMSHVMEPHYFNFFMDIKINLSSAYPAYLFYLFQDPFIEFPLLFGIHLLLYSIYIFLGLKVLESLLKGKILISVLYLKLFLVFMHLITQVYINEIFSIKILIFILLIIFLESNFFNVSNKKKRKNSENFIYKWNQEYRGRRIISFVYC